MRVLKWNVPVDDKMHGIGEGKIALVDSLYGPEAVQVWTVEPGSGVQANPRQAVVIGTGQEAPDDWEHIGSVATAGGALVWHVFAEPGEGN